jgi:YVTN family beta-propeller protein
MKYVQMKIACPVQVRCFCVLALFVSGWLAINQSILAVASDGATDNFWQQIEATALPKGYQGATHQEFVEAQMGKMEDSQRSRVGQLWKEREKSDPQMTNRGASFVKIMMFVAGGEKLDGKPTATEKPENPKPDKAWFRKGATEKQPIVKAIDATKNLRQAGHPTLLSPHVDALALHDGRLFVVNTPADTLDVIDTDTKRVVARVPVGVDPVCVTVRPDGREVWVSNYISDTVSVIDNDAQSPTYMMVVATIQDIDLRKKSTCFDEPSGIAFADNTKAYVALSSSNRIAVIDVNSRQVVKHIPIPSQEPRSLRVRNGRLYVVPFESHNQTQLSGGKPEDIDGHQVTFDAEKLAAAFDSAGFTVDIIKHPATPDRDLYVLDTKTDQVIKTVNTLGTLQYGFDVDEKGTVLIAHTEARNHINGLAGTKKHGLKEMENRPYLNRIAKVSASGEAEFFDLNPQLPNQPDRETAIATPSAIHIQDGIAYMTAAGSDHLVTLDAETGEVLAQVTVGSVPRGVVVQRQPDDRRTAWVLNSVDNSVTQVDVTSPKKPEIRATVSLDDPTPAKDKAGLAAFHSARASSNGTFSCASCHPDGHTDQLLWVLDTPHIVGADQIEPRLSQQLRGLRDTAPYHWDGIPGDPYGGSNASTHEQLPPNCDINKPESAVRHLIDGGMASTMLQHGSDAVNDEGKRGYLTAAQRDAMAECLLNLNHKPPRARAYTDELSDEALTGIERFHITGNRDKKNANTMVCGMCHPMPYLTTDQGSMNVPSFRGALDRFIMQAQGRQNIISLVSYKEVAEKGWPAEESWQRMLHGGEPNRLMPVIDMFKEASTAFSGAFGRQVTLDKQTTQDPVTLDLLAALETAAMQGTIVLEVTGKILKPGMNAEPISLTFDSRTDRFATLQPGKADYSRSELMNLAENGEFLGTFTGHHPGDVVSVPPAIWTSGSLHKQRGVQLFPRVNEDRMSMTISGRHIQDGASLFVNGRRVNGSIESVGTDLITVTFDTLPSRGMNMLQVQNPDSYFSNDFIFFVETENEAVARYAREPGFLLKAILNSAIVNDNPEEARIALQAGAEMDEPHKHFELERPPLILAALYGRESLVDELLRREASPNIQDRNGTTALHEAARMGRLEICKKLLAAVANPDIANKWKERPADLTERFVNKGNFEKHFLPWNVNLTLDHEQYLRDRLEVQKLLTVVTSSSEVDRTTDSWTGWLGKNRNGWTDMEPPTAWPQSLNKEWSVEVGTGYGSPLVVEDRIYQHARQGEEEVVWCLERSTGKLRWQKSFPVPFKTAAGGEYHGNGPKSSPAYSDNRLFVMSLNGTLTAWDASSGDKLWERNYDVEFGKSHPNWGASASPIIDGEHVFVHFGTDDVGALVALNVATGEEVWRHGKDGASYSSPLVAEFDGVQQVVQWNHRALVGVDRQTGEFLWEFPLEHVGGDQNMPTPAIHNGRVLLGAENRGIFGLRPERKDGKWSVTEEWHQEKVALDMSSAIINGDYLYGFSHYDSGRLFCLDPKTGEIMWTGPPRTGQNVMFLSAPGQIAALINNGELRILSGTPKEYRQLASYRVADDNTWAPPVLLRDGLLIKDLQHLTKWSLKPREQK